MANLGKLVIVSALDGTFQRKVTIYLETYFFLISAANRSCIRIRKFVLLETKIRTRIDVAFENFKSLHRKMNQL